MKFIDLIQNYYGKQILVGGHRGHQSETRENTIQSFIEVKNEGIKYVEIDVQLSNDNQAVIFHDQDLSERTPLSGTIRDYSVQELKASFELCTLEEAVIWCKKHGMFMLLEIKSKNYDDVTERPILARQIIDVIKCYQFQDACIPLSIDYRILKLIKREIPEINVAIIVGTPPDDPVKLMKDMQASIYLSYLEDMNQDIVQKLHAAGYYVDGSVVNTKERLAQASALQVDMIESDHPATIRQFIFN